MTLTDRTIASHGLPRHPSPSDIAETLERAARALNKSGQRALELASVLAARGYGASTLGDGGSRGTDPTSSTERAAGTDGPIDRRWIEADHYYADLLRTAWRTAINLEARTHELLRHADDQDPTPAGTGECLTCTRVCRPTRQRPDFRLRSGLCPSCRNAWANYQRTDGQLARPDWISRRREAFTERDTAGNVIQVHQAEDDGHTP